MRELLPVAYDAAQFKDEALLYRNRLLEPTQLDASLTYIYGKDSNVLPLTTLTKGSGNVFGVKPKGINGDTQYTWPIMGRTKHTSPVLALVTGGTQPGVAFSTFEVDFEDNWLIPQYGAITPDGLTQVRIQAEPVKISSKRFRYRMVIVGSDPTAYVASANFTAGKSWVMTAPTIPQSKSMGNRSNSTVPGKLTNQYSLHRFSYQIAGNMANKVTPIEFDLVGGGKTNLWIPFDMGLFEQNRMFMCEQALWEDVYNRDSNGQITLIDEETGEPIPRGAGVKEILTQSGQYDTFAPASLTMKKFDTILDRISSNNPDFRNLEIVIYTGMGGIRAANESMLKDAINKGFLYKLSDVEIQETADGLTYGKYFTRYKTIDGRLVSFVQSNYFDYGSIAEMQRTNGDMYNGFPKYSYEMVFLDHSANKEGKRNIEMVNEEGREYITGVYKGMSKVPDVWKAVPDGNVISTRRDVAYYEVISTQGICIKNPFSSFWMGASI